MPLGIVLYVPVDDELHFRFREKMSLIEPDDVAVVADMSSTFQSIAIERGAGATFEWLESSLSNTVRAEGPFSVIISNPETVLTELYTKYVESD